jgi:serine/threonine protein kinase
MATEYELYKEGGLLNSRYQKLEDISKGAYGIVSLAKDLHKQKLVAVKYIFKLDDEGAPKKKDYANFSKSVKKMDSDVCEEALHEISIHEKLGHHKYIVEFIDCFDSFIILEYCSRGDLYEAIQADIGPSSTKDIVNVMLQLISAVEYAHSQNIYHRDIKPENILIANDWTIRLSDWGLASESRYCNDFGVGSERYMAPELFDDVNLQIYDAAKCDVWSIGICLLNLVFKKSPFTKASEKDKSFTYFLYNREALFDIFSSMSLDLFSVLRYSLAIDPDNRDLGKMKEELLNVQSLTIDDDLELFKDEIPEAKPMDIEKPPIQVYSDANEKIFETQTPNTHIADHFHEFKKQLFNRKDYFTPPSDAAHYLHDFSKDRKGVYQPPHQRPTTPKSAGHLVPAASRFNRPRRSFNSFSHHTNGAGKYVPPNLRLPAYVENGQKPSHLSSTVEVAVFENDEDEENQGSSMDDDEIFVLEESVNLHNGTDAGVDKVDSLITHINLEDDLSDSSSSVPSLLAPIHMNDTKTPSNLSKEDSGKDHRHSNPSNSIANGKKAYVPPHHRQNFQSQWKQSYWNNLKTTHSTAKNHVYDQRNRNSGHSRHGQQLHAGNNNAPAQSRRYSVPASMSSSVPIHRTNWFNYHNKNMAGGEFGDIDDDDFEVDELLDDDDFEDSEMYRKFASRVGKFSELNHNTGDIHEEVSYAGDNLDLKKGRDVGEVGT